MADGLVLSIDGMGGDRAPDIVIEGVELIAKSRPDVTFLLHGDPSRLEALLSNAPAARAASRVFPAERAIGMEVKPSQALRQGKGSSLWNAIASVESGEAHAVVSAGNTGALMAISMFRLRTIAGVHRPALVASWPTMRGSAAVLDVGANVEADAEQLVEFAIMGEAFHRAVHGKARPTVGLLNVGAEDQKGHEEIRAAARLMREAKLELDFHGFVEGDDIGKGTVDVFVTDGFTGNIALKTAEGTARFVGHFLREALTSTALAKLGALIARPALQKLRERMDPSSVNGAVFLGLNGVVVKSHGGATGPGFAAAIEVAARLAKSHYRDEIERNLLGLARAEAATAGAGETT
ncbi:MAG TPA: phosphate acyltransferase PlsX [Caulobacterales bacterium]|nr:phosphate acyltransferase PlsX [Caulobacterales bacterium]